jgi:hypothetical protein
MKNRKNELSELYKLSSVVSENLKYHIENGVSILNNIFRPTSDSYYSLIKEARHHKDMFDYINDEEKESLFETDIGSFGLYDGEEVPLDMPLPDEEYFGLDKEAAEYKGRKVKLNRPMRSSGPKKYKVYVKDPKTKNIRKINFGDKKGGLKLNIHDAAARKSFVARHKCKKKKNKMSAGYWACRIGRYKHLIGGKKTYTWW